MSGNIHAQMTTTIEIASGHLMPLVGLGIWEITDEFQIQTAVEAGIASGFRHFDTATLHKNEAQLGKALKRCIESGQVSREELFIVTKLPYNGMAPERVEMFLKSSLQRLQLDYVDLYLIHWPVGVVFTTEEDLLPLDKDGNVRHDPTTNLEAVWEAMEKQVEDGRATAIGISNFNVKQIQRILKVAKIHPACLQIEAYAYFQNTVITQFAMSKNISVCVYGVLGSRGRKDNPKALAGWEGEFFPIPVLQDESVKQIGSKYNKTAAQVLLRYFVQHNIAVLSNSSHPRRIEENMNIFDFRLDESDMRVIEGLEKGPKFRAMWGFQNIHKHHECPWDDA